MCCRFFQPFPPGAFVLAEFGKTYVVVTHAQPVLGFNIAIFCRLLQPAVCRFLIFLNAIAIAGTPEKLVLRLGVAAHRCFFQPVEGAHLGAFVRAVLAVVQGEGVHGVAFVCGGFGEPVVRDDVAARDAVTIMIEVGEVVAGVVVVQAGGGGVVLRGALRVAGDAFAAVVEDAEVVQGVAILAICGLGFSPPVVRQTGVFFAGFAFVPGVAEGNLRQPVACECPFLAFFEGFGMGRKRVFALPEFDVVPGRPGRGRVFGEGSGRRGRMVAGRSGRW